jgi:hypothetical protein
LESRKRAEKQKFGKQKAEIEGEKQKSPDQKQKASGKAES